jgi:hypothetical protein
MDPVWKVALERRTFAVVEVRAATYEEALSQLAECDPVGEPGPWKPLSVTDEHGTEVWRKPGFPNVLTPQAVRALLSAIAEMNAVMRRAGGELARARLCSPSDHAPERREPGDLRGPW